MQSIISNELQCLICELPLPQSQLYQHNIFYGNDREHLCKEFGCWCYLCARHHHTSGAGVHWNKEVDRKLKAHTQKRFNEVYPNIDFVRIFGEDYLREGTK